MESHYIHYIRRQVKLSNSDSDSTLWLAEERQAAGFEQPEYHITRAINGAAAEIEAGDIIWLVSQLYSPWGKLPPALDARIKVKSSVEIRDNDGNPSGFRYIAANGSRWFPLRDVSGVLDTLKTIRRDGETQPLRKNSRQPIGQVLQRLRKLESAAPLLAWEQTVDKDGFDFVSYRLIDGNKRAFEKVRSITGAGGAVFWDRWSLPRRLTERQNTVSGPAIQKYVEDQIKQAKIVWGIDSPLYGQEGSYSLIEMSLAKKLKKYSSA
jgi:hypothetical protein